MDDLVPPCIQEHSGGDCEFVKLVEVYEALVDDVSPCAAPKPEILFSILSTLFPNAVTIPSTSTGVIEFEEVSKVSGSRS